MLRDLEVQNAVLVSPSLSGSYALPFLMRTHHQLRGFVPIAPTSTRNYTQEQFWAVKVLRQWSAKILAPCPCPWLVPHGGGLRGLAPEVAWKGWSVGARLPKGIAIGLDPHQAPRINNFWPCPADPNSYPVWGTGPHLGARITPAAPPPAQPLCGEATQRGPCLLPPQSASFPPRSSCIP